MIFCRWGLEFEVKDRLDTGSGRIWFRWRPATGRTWSDWNGAFVTMDDAMQAMAALALEAA